MTTMHHSPIAAPTQATTRKTVAVAWSIARAACLEAAPHFVEQDRRARDVYLRIVIIGDACIAEIDDPARTTASPIELGRCGVTVLEADGFRHVEARDGADIILAATIRIDGDTDRLLYAKTSLLERLGIKGGRYGRPQLAD